MRKQFLIVVAVTFYLLSTSAVNALSREKRATDEEAPYTVIRRYGKGFEERMYPAQKWICQVTIENNYGLFDNLAQFGKITSYRDGENDQKLEGIPMTIPVSMKKTTNETGSVYQMCLYIPSYLQDNTPQPTGEGVSIVEIPDRIIYAKRYSGYVLTEDQWNSRAASFKADLNQKGRYNTNFDFYFGCGFSSPSTFFNRRNEIWYLKT